MAINFPNLQNIFNSQIDLLLSSNGLTTKCLFNYGITNTSVCPNCIYDPNLKKSSNKYKNGGPIPFVLGMICPYCNGIGFYGVSKSDEAYLAIIWDYKKWINPPINVNIADGYIQTICPKKYINNIKQCKDLTVFYYENGNNPTFQLYGEPNPIGLGDNAYLTCVWKKVGTQNQKTATQANNPTVTPITYDTVISSINNGGEGNYGVTLSGPNVVLHFNKIADAQDVGIKSITLYKNNTAIAVITLYGEYLSSNKQFKLLSTSGTILGSSLFASAIRISDTIYRINL
jgi:hypothetical protein